MLDVFAGMCSVGEAVGPTRQVWTNDAQVFASQVGAALFTSRVLPLRSQSIADIYHTRFHEALARGSEKWRAHLEIESDALAASTFEEFAVARSALRSALNHSPIATPVSYPSLFTRQYADTFFGLRQALEIDAIVEAVRGYTPTALMEDAERWLMIALGRTMLRVSTTTGHFAQFLSPKLNNFRTFQRQRRRMIWQEWLESNEEMQPVGDDIWRSQNRSFNEDALTLLPRLVSEKMKPSVIYADPPYTNDQYSRYYHVLETLFLYDYPSTSGAGVYRDGRFVTKFSLKSQSVASLEALVGSAARLGADLVLSYPTNGLAYSKGFEIEDLLRRSYRDVEICHAISHDHSTFGASKGQAKSAVVEKIYLGRV
ncbi:DNA adenine methylase [Sphingomonas sp.]|uniref:DNA adenine methylase n=1 Tax=Sphingomonas sp. TaxID=28214 RepID=UPI001B0A4BAD|nr:DNA adenine methylase [Sphingomonas sp.]MBO9714255.1 DNA adenine methylase [Sphingomonas sp.]